MAFHEVSFPLNPDYGSRGGPAFRVDITTLDGGQEVRIQRSSQARREYNARHQIRQASDIAKVIDFFHARGGDTHGFRYRDWSDYSTASDHVSEPNANNDSLGTGDGTTTSFQLVKRYASGSNTHVRTIEKPEAGSVVVALNGTTQASGWSVDTATGLITFDTAPANGVEVTAGCLFDVPVRFNTGGEPLQVSINDWQNHGIAGDVPMIELIGENPAPEDYNPGGAVELGISADTNLSLSNGTLQVIEASTTGLSVNLPAKASTETGFVMAIVQEGANAFAVKDADTGTTVVTLSAAMGGMFFLTLDQSGNKVWYHL